MDPERERVLATAQELAHVGGWELDLRSGGMLWSDETYRILGLRSDAGARTHEEVLEFVHPDDRERMAQVLTQAPKRAEETTGDHMNHEFRVVRTDGAVRDVRIRATVERDEEDRPLRLIGVIQDVTDQHVGEHELRAHYAVTQALREWESFEEGVVALLDRLGTALRFPMGTLWIWNDDIDALACRAFWSVPDVDSSFFECEKRRLTFRPGQGKPGSAWKQQEPVVTPDAFTDPVFQPREAAVARGVRSGLAFPALSVDGPLAVLSYYSFEHRVPSQSLVRTLTAIGHELGDFLSHRRADLGPKPVSARESEILWLAAEGNSGPQIAERLFLAPSTVKTHFENIYEKLGVSDRAAAVAQAIRTGVIV